MRPHSKEEEFMGQRVGGMISVSYTQHMKEVVDTLDICIMHSTYEGGG